MVKLYSGTSIEKGEKLINKIFPDISYWSNNYETLEHYYEGCVLELTIDIDEKLRDDYIADIEELMIPLREYEYGVQEVKYPAGAMWYSISRKYILTHKFKIREVSLDYARRKLEYGYDQLLEQA